jgi:L-lactate utilization protein LutC
MNKLFSLRNASTALVLTALLAPAAALAQQGPSPDQMQAIGQQIQALHAEAHAKMLAAITPAHRKLVEKLKADRVPDEKATKVVDAALTPSETAATLKIDDERRAREHKLVASAGPGLMLQEGKADPGELLLASQHLQLMAP